MRYEGDNKPVRCSGSIECLTAPLRSPPGSAYTLSRNRGERPEGVESALGEGALPTLCCGSMGRDVEAVPIPKPEERVAENPTVFADQGKLGESIGKVAEDVCYDEKQKRRRKEEGNRCGKWVVQKKKSIR